MIHKAYAQYRQTQIETATPGQILLMLYDGAIRYCRQARERILARDAAGKGMFISKADAIIAELVSTLDHSKAPDLCKNLEALYLYMQDQLALANAKMDPEPIDIVVRLMSNLHSAWVEAVANTDKATARGGGSTATGTAGR
jgi:flagellar protein FliS